MAKKAFVYIVFGIFFLTEVCATEAIYDEALRLLQMHKKSHYSHHRVIDENKGYFDVDCSSFVDYLLEKKAPLARQELPIDKGHVRARAQNFHDYFKRLEEAPTAHWKAIKTIDALEVGDIIAWKYDASLKKKDTGHVVVVAQKAIQEDKNLYWLRIIDASKSKHAFDTKEGAQTGIGSGIMWFRVNDQGIPIALHWSSKAKKEVHHSIAMGRVLDTD